MVELAWVKSKATPMLGIKERYHVWYGKRLLANIDRTSIGWIAHINATPFRFGRRQHVKLFMEGVAQGIIKEKTTLRNY